MNASQRVTWYLGAPHSTRWLTGKQVRRILRKSHGVLCAARTFDGEFCLKSPDHEDVMHVSRRYAWPREELN